MEKVSFKQFLLLKFPFSTQIHAPVAQWIEHRTSNPMVVGSNPTGGALDSLEHKSRCM